MIKYIKSTELCELWWLELWFENLCCLDLRLLFSNLTFLTELLLMLFCSFFWWLENLAHLLFFMLATVFAFLIRNELTWFGCERVILLHDQSLIKVKHVLSPFFVIFLEFLDKARNFGWFHRFFCYFFWAFVPFFWKLKRLW